MTKSQKPYHRVRAAPLRLFTTSCKGVQPHSKVKRSHARIWKRKRCSAANECESQHEPVIVLPASRVLIKRSTSSLEVLVLHARFGRTPIHGAAIRWHSAVNHGFNSNCGSPSCRRSSDRACTLCWVMSGIVPPAGADPAAWVWP